MTLYGFLSKILSKQNNSRAVDRYYGGVCTVGFVIGIFLFYKLSSIENAELFKLFNISGLTLDVFGVIILSQILFSRESENQLFFDALYGTIMTLSLIIPLGMLMSTLLTLLIRLPSSLTVEAFSISTFRYISIPLLIADTIADSLAIKSYATTEGRLKLIGAYFVFTGFMTQLFASWLDLAGE